MRDRGPCREPPPDPDARGSEGEPDPSLCPRRPPGASQLPSLPTARVGKRAGRRILPEKLPNSAPRCEAELLFYNLFAHESPQGSGHLAEYPQARAMPGARSLLQSPPPAQQPPPRHFTHGNTKAPLAGARSSAAAPAHRGGSVPGAETPPRWPLGAPAQWPCLVGPSMRSTASAGPSRAWLSPPKPHTPGGLVGRTSIPAPTAPWDSAHCGPWSAYTVLGARS